MAYPSIRNTLNGLIRGDKVNENFAGLASDLSDGTKDILISTLAVAGSSSVSAVQCGGNCTVSGDSKDEKTYIQLVNGVSNGLSPGQYFLTWDGYDGDVDAQANGTYLHRSGSIIGYGLQYGFTTPGTAFSFSMDVGKWDGSSSSTVLALGTLTFPVSQMSTKYSTLTRNVYSFTSGDILFVRYSQTASAAPVNYAFSLYVEVQWDS